MVNSPKLSIEGVQYDRQQYGISSGHKFWTAERMLDRFMLLKALAKSSLITMESEAILDMKRLVEWIAASAPLGVPTPSWIGERYEIRFVIARWHAHFEANLRR